MRRGLVLWGCCLAIAAAGCSDKRDASSAAGSAPASASAMSAKSASSAKPAEAKPTSAAPSLATADASAAPAETGLPGTTARDAKGGPRPKAYRAPGLPADFGNVDPETERLPTTGGDDKPVPNAAVAYDLEGKISDSAVSSTIDKNISSFDVCFESDVSVVIEARVLPSGSVAEVRSPASHPDEPKVRDCVADVFKKLVFPNLQGTEPARLSLELFLHRKVSY
ncbi:MAG: hypothetical protein U0271_16730 [Polyangiaceae bacterium]